MKPAKFFYIFCETEKVDFSMGKGAIFLSKFLDEERAKNIFLRILAEFLQANSAEKPTIHRDF